MNEKQIIQIYDFIVSYDHGFEEMIKEIANIIFGKVLEIGPGTGLLTKKIAEKINKDNLVTIDVSKAFVTKFKENLPEQKIIRADAVNYNFDEKFDCIVMSLVYHHIDDKKKEKFLKNMFNILSENGKIIIGDVFILPYTSDVERNKSLKAFHYERIANAKSELVQEVEKQALKEGLKRQGEWKTSEEVLRSQLAKVGLRKIKSTNIDNQDTGGYRIIIASK